MNFLLKELFREKEKIEFEYNSNFHIPHNILNILKKIEINFSNLNESGFLSF